MDDQAIEQEIQAKGKTAPRITPAHIQATIRTAYYFTAAQGVDGADVQAIREATPNQETSWCPLNDDADPAKTAMAPLMLLTFCVLVLRNGFTVTGESACASPENFDAEIGRKIARQNAEAKIWALEGYALKQRLHDCEMYDRATAAHLA